MKKDFAPVAYRFFQFVDELFHYIGFTGKFPRKFCLWANRKK